MKEELRLSNKHNYSQYSSKRRDTESGATAVHAAKIDKPAVSKVESKVATAEVKMEVTPAPAIVEAPVAPIEPALVNENVETVSLPGTVSGVVTNCSKLNVRSEPSLFADVVCVLDVATEIKIDVAQSHNEWFKICTAAGTEGYCMRKFVKAYM